MVAQFMFGRWNWYYALTSKSAMLHDDGILTFDDIIEEKPYSNESDLIVWHYDHSEGRDVKVSLQKLQSMMAD